MNQRVLTKNIVIISKFYSWIVTEDAISHDFPKTSKLYQWSPSKVKPGQSATINCGALGAKELWVQWYHERVPIKEDDPRFKIIQTFEGKKHIINFTFISFDFYSGNSKMTLKNATVNERGKYLCEIYNQVGSIYVSGSILFPSSDYLEVEGRKISFRWCVILSVS